MQVNTSAYSGAFCKQVCRCYASNEAQMQVRALECHPQVLKYVLGKSSYFLHASWRIDQSDLLQSIGNTIHTVVWFTWWVLQLQILFRCPHKAPPPLHPENDTNLIYGNIIQFSHDEKID
jgi:hypothetical protein